MKMCSSSKVSEPLAVNKTIIVAKQVEMAKMFKEKVIFCQFNNSQENVLVFL